MVVVLARGVLSRGASSRAFRTEHLKRGEVCAENDTIFMDLDPDRRLTIQDHDGHVLPATTVRSVPLAGDVQNRNLELLCEPEGPGVAWRIRLLKDVHANEAVEMWFSEEVLAKLNMPFLTPRNIKGRKNYVCHECGVQFEQPNPLKIHLFLSCETYSTRKFWRRFLQRFDRESTPLNLSTDRSVSRNPVVFERRRSHENAGSGPEKSSRCYSEPPFSAFRPYRFTADVTSNWINHFNYNPINSILLHQRLSLPHLEVHPSIAESPKYFWEAENRVRAVSKTFESISTSNAAEAEAIATDWGKSKEGHLCLYCGKVYSRKYGLKIHIRTHTGYKPLQCKYCLRPFGDPSNLNKHVRLHAQSDTPYGCRVCGKMLVRKRDLERHVRSRHTGDDDVDGMTTSIRDSPSP